MKRLLTILLLAIIPLGIMSFNTPLRDAEHEREMGNYHAAIIQYDKALGKKPNKSDKAYILYQKGECFRILVEWNEALKCYDKAIKSGYSNDVVYLRRADAKRYKGDYTGALADYEEYRKRVPNDPAGEKGIRSCELSVKWMQEKTSCESPWIIKNENDLNTRDHDFSPAWSDKKHKSIFISSKRPGQTGSHIDPISGNLYCDVFESRQNKNGQWSVPSSVQGDVNSNDANEGSPVITKNGNRMYFTRCGQVKKTIVTCKIYFADKSGNGWNNANVVDFGLDAATLDSFNFRHPAVSADGQIMVFSSDMTGSRGSDLWMSFWNSKSKSWGKPTRLGSEINSDGREAFPYIHEDGMLYFASDGHPGMGGFDNFSASKTDANTWKWSAAENLKYPLNSSADDFGIIFTPDKRGGYLTSSREGTKGGDDIWSFAVDPLQCPMRIDGTVMDGKNNVPVENALVHLTGTDGSRFDLLSDVNGYFGFKAKQNTTYTITIEGQEAHSTKAGAYFNLPENDKVTVMAPVTCPCIETVRCTIAPIDSVEIKFPAVLYEYDSDKLTAGSKDSLNYLFRLLTDNPTMVIELGSHTDCRGSANYNKDLSQRRAQACVNYLVNEKGIPRERIVAKGYGESQPFRLDAGTPLTEKYIAGLPKEKQEYYHSLNRRTVFRVLNYSYAPKGKNGELIKTKPPIIKKGYFDNSDSAWDGGELIEEEKSEKDN